MSFQLPLIKLVLVVMMVGRSVGNYAMEGVVGGFQCDNPANAINQLCLEVPPGINPNRRIERAVVQSASQQLDSTTSDSEMVSGQHRRLGRWARPDNLYDQCCDGHMCSTLEICETRCSVESDICRQVRARQAKR